MCDAPSHPSLNIVRFFFQLIILAAFIAVARASGVISPPVAVAPVTRTVVAEPYDPNPQYSYGYEVQDPLTGDSHGQVETRSGDVVRGSYALLDSDGTRRQVDYSADPINGFNAVVSKQGVAVAAPVAPAVAPVLRSAPVVAAPVAPVAPVFRSAHIAAPVAPVLRTAAISAPVAPVAPVLRTAAISTQFASVSPVARVAPVAPAPLLSSAPVLSAPLLRSAPLAPLSPFAPLAGAAPFVRSAATVVSDPAWAAPALRSAPLW